MGRPGAPRRAGGWKIERGVVIRLRGTVPGPTLADRAALPARWMRAEYTGGSCAAIAAGRRPVPPRLQSGCSASDAPLKHAFGDAGTDLFGSHERVIVRHPAYKIGGGLFRGA